METWTGSATMFELAPPLKVSSTGMLGLWSSIVPMPLVPLLLPVIDPELRLVSVFHLITWFWLKSPHFYRFFCLHQISTLPFPFPFDLCCQLHVVSEEAPEPPTLRRLHLWSKQCRYAAVPTGKTSSCCGDPADPSDL